MFAVHPCINQYTPDDIWDDTLAIADYTLDPRENVCKKQK